MQTRIYVPTTTTGIRRLAVEGVLADLPIAGYAVTPALRQAHPGADEEDLEYAAFLDATSAAVIGGARSGGLGSTPARRVVLAADVDADAVVEAGDVGGGAGGSGAGSAVLIREPIARRQIVSLHVQAPSTVVAGADEYLWYDVTELDALVADLG